MKTILFRPLTISIFIFLLAFSTACTRHFNLSKKEKAEMEQEASEEDGYDGPDKIALFDIKRTKDPVTNRVPRELYPEALRRTLLSASNAHILNNNIWKERGPYCDAVGHSNPNTRANNGIASGRVRAICVDLLDNTGKSVWAAGVDGGIWYTSDITAATPVWNIVNDYLSNLAISFICQDPNNPNTLYFCTGESYYNLDAVQGNGVFKSTDHGITWNQLPSTSSYTLCSRIVCDAAGNVYLGTNGHGLLRSVNGGTTWTTITPSGIGSRISDIEISSTGRMHVSSGIFSNCYYRYTDLPQSVTASGWTSAQTPYGSSSQRTELGCYQNTLYALPVDNNYQVPTVYKSTDGGAHWAATNAQPPTGWASKQGWYSLTCGIDPSNTNNVIIGGLDNYKTTDGGNSWTKISNWIGTTGQYVHADNHATVWYDNGNKLLMCSDGGVFFSSDRGTTIRDRNTGLRIKQFYSCAFHPDSTNYFLAGAQDNGVHQFNNPGLSNTIEVTGGDGGNVAIDQFQPQYQFGAYVYSNYRRSTDGGNTWSSVNFSSTKGQFINPYDYDNYNKHIFAGDTSGYYLYWDNPQTGNAFVRKALTSLGSDMVSAVYVYQNGADTVFLGTDAGQVIKVADASTDNPIDYNLTSNAMPSNAYLNCINSGTSSQYLVACYSNYNVNNIWVSSDYGNSWTGIDGNLPNMPVYWAIFIPGSNSKMMIATETGVWLTTFINGSQTSWTFMTGFPTVRTDMLKCRTSDGLVVAATHGRGLWTLSLSSIAAQLADYVFNGDGLWTDSSNWLNDNIPPATLQPGQTILIDPGTGGKCTLNIPYNLAPDTKIIVNDNKSFEIQGNLTINHQ